MYDAWICGAVLINLVGNHKSNGGKLFLVGFDHYCVSYGLRYIIFNTFTPFAREGINWPDRSDVFVNVMMTQSCLDCRNAF
jgi:hypothetical protein